MNRFLVIAGLIAILLSSVACRRQAAADYDRINLILLHDLFAAIHDGDHAAAIKKLERLQDLNPDVTDIGDLIRAEQDTEVIAVAEYHLQRGDVRGALESVQSARLKSGASPVLIEAQAGLGGLVAIADFQERMSTAEPRRFASAVAALPEPAAFGEAASIYEAWHRQQRYLAAERLGELKTRRMNELTREIAITLVSRSPTRLGSQLDQLATFSGDHPVVAAAAIAPLAVGLPHQWRGLTSQTEREVVAFLYYYRGPAADRVDITEAAAAWKPETPCGLYLLADLALGRKDTARGLALLRQLLDQVPEADLRSLFPAFERLMDRQAAPPPSVPGVLDEISRLAAPAR